MFSQFRLLDQMGQWLGSQELAAADLDERIIDRFFDKQGRPGTTRKGDYATARRLVDHLRQLGVIPVREAATDEQPLARLESRYEQYLRMERGLSSDAVRNYRPVVHRFLVERFPDAPLRLRELHAADPSAFILRHAPSLSLGRAKLMVTALRFFARFLLQHGEIDINLVAAVPPIWGWRQASVPKYLGASEVQRLLEGCTRDTATGRRNYAILLLLARLGLRAGEVVALQLDDPQYPWPGNMRELEQCARNIIVHGTYVPELPYADPSTDTADPFLNGVRSGTLTVDELVQGYCARVQAQTGSFRETARHLNLHRETVAERVRAWLERTPAPDAVAPLLEPADDNGHQQAKDRHQRPSR